MGANLPCTNAKDISWSPLAPYELTYQYKWIDNFTTIAWDSNTEYDNQKYDNIKSMN